MASYTCGIWAFGQILDRYATDGYGPAVGTLDAIALAGKVEGLVGLDLNYPFSEGVTVDDVAQAMAQQELRTVCITPVIYNRRFSKGAFTNPDPQVRRAARQIVDGAVEVAGRLNARYVKFWPGQDGHDYPFQVDYQRLRGQSVDAMREIGQAWPDTTFGIEYKLKEPRTRLFWSTAAASILALDDAGVDNIGLVIDWGHSLFAKENPAESLCLIHERGRLIDVELCDNYREWDDDLTVGALHLTETLEFLHLVDELDWTEPLKLDLFPYREDPAGAAQVSIDITERLRDRAARIPADELSRIREQHDALAAQRLAHQALLG